MVFFKVGASTDATAQDHANELVRRLIELRGQIPSLLRLEAGVDFSRSSASYDVGLLTEFADAAGLEAYRIHPLHQEVVKFVQQVCSARAVVDFAS